MENPAGHDLAHDGAGFGISINIACLLGKIEQG